MLRPRRLAPTSVHCATYIRRYYYVVPKVLEVDTEVVNANANAMVLLQTYGPLLLLAIIGVTLALMWAGYCENERIKEAQRDRDDRDGDDNTA